MSDVSDDKPVRAIRTERVNESRHVRTFGCDEVLALLRDAVLDEAGVSEYASKRTRSTVLVMAPGLPETLTVKVTTPEDLY